MRLTSLWFSMTISVCWSTRCPKLSEPASMAAPNVVVFAGTQWSITGTCVAVSLTAFPHSRVPCVGSCERSRILESFSSSLKFSFSMSCARSSSSCARFRFATMCGYVGRLLDHEPFCIRPHLLSMAALIVAMASRWRRCAASASRLYTSWLALGISVFFLAGTKAIMLEAAANQPLSPVKQSVLSATYRYR